MALPPAADRCALHLLRLLHALRAAAPEAEAAHTLLVAHPLAPEAKGCLPDQLADLIGTTEATLREIGARVPPQQRAA